MESVFMEITIGHRSLRWGKTCIVKLHERHEFTKDYVEPAKLKACEKLGLDASEAVVLSWSYLGEGVVFC